MNKAKDYLIKNKALGMMVLTTLVLFLFVSTHTASATKAILKITRLDFANGYWNYRADYTLRNLYDGSLKVNGAIFVNNINQSGSSETGYALKPGRKYTFTFYSKSGGKDRILASKIVVAPKAPGISQITPAPITTPTPTPTYTSTPITKNGFLLSGALCNIDYTLAPQSESNARRLIDLCEKNVPVLEAKFGRGPSGPPYRMQFYVPGPGSGGQGTNSDSDAYVAGGQFYLSTSYWQTEHSNDAGIVAHELTHVIQSFYGYNTPEYPGWLVEALADYGVYTIGYSNDLEIRCYHFLNDMQNQLRVYGCTYKFLKFIENKYDSTIAFKLNKALQSRSYSENLFTQYTGKTFNQLTNECSQDASCGGVYHGGL